MILGVVGSREHTRSTSVNSHTKDDEDKNEGEHKLHQTTLATRDMLCEVVGAQSPLHWLLRRAFNQPRSNRGSKQLTNTTNDRV